MPYDRVSFFSSEIVVATIMLPRPDPSTLPEEVLHQSPALLFASNISVFLLSTDQTPDITLDNDEWCAMVVNLSSESMTIVVPSLINSPYHEDNELPFDVANFAERFKIRVNQMLAYGFEATDEIEPPHITEIRFLGCGIRNDISAERECLSTLCASPGRREDSGMFILSYFKFFVDAVPFCCRSVDYQHQRRKWCYYMWHGEIH